jgi:hypothetical protein
VRAVRRAVKCGYVTLRAEGWRGGQRRGGGRLLVFFDISPPSGHQCHSLNLVVLVIVVAVVVLMNLSFRIRWHQQITKSPLTFILTHLCGHSFPVGHRIFVTSPRSRPTSCRTPAPYSGTDAPTTTSQQGSSLWATSSCS